MERLIRLGRRQHDGIWNVDGCLQHDALQLAPCSRCCRQRRPEPGLGSAALPDRSQAKSGYQVWDESRIDVRHSRPRYFELRVPTNSCKCWIRPCVEPVEIRGVAHSKTKLSSPPGILLLEVQDVPRGLGLRRGFRDRAVLLDFPNVSGRRLRLIVERK